MAIDERARDTGGAGTSTAVMCRLAAAARRHWAIVALAIVAAVLLFTSLGRDYLWEDEGDTAVLARSILQHGVPTAWDGVTFTAPDYGERLIGPFVMISHPWLQYYAAAASFALFGDTPWAARLPFALAGLATIVLVYAMMLAWLGDRLAAFSAALLLTLNVQFLLFSRQARNYSLHALLTCLLIWQFRRLNSWRNAAIFAGLGILLFHAHPIGLAAVASLGALTLVYRPFSSVRRWFWPAALVVGLYAVPWLVASRHGYEWNTNPLDDASLFVPRLLQFAVECASVAPIVGLVALFLTLRLRRRPPLETKPRKARRRRRASLLMPEERLLAAACGAVIGGEAFVMALAHSRDVMWVVGLHHTPAVIPLVVMLTAMILTKISGRRRMVWAALMLVFAFTRLPQAVPWTFWAEPTPLRDSESVVTFHVPRSLVDRVLRTTQFQYLRSLVQVNPGIITRVAEFLRMNAAPGDVVITNYSWEPLYFHSGLAQGMKVAPSFPIYPVVRSSRLPDYVFSTAGVRWIVWRRAWPAYFREQDCERILRQLAAAGVKTELVLSIPETLYENRENVHFHRFPGDTYVFPHQMDLPDTLIYRVDWPEAQTRG